jgi:Toprim domain
VAVLLLPLTFRQLYLARDADKAGNIALAALTERAEAAGVEALVLSPQPGDFNEDLRASGIVELRAALRIQLAPQDVFASRSGQRRR